VGVNGSPRSPLNSFINRRSLELLLRRTIPGATSLLFSRRARRPLSQSTQLIEPSIGMQGTFNFEFMGCLRHQGFALVKITSASGTPPAWPTSRKDWSASGNMSATCSRNLQAALKQQPRAPQHGSNEFWKGLVPPHPCSSEKQRDPVKGVPRASAVRAIAVDSSTV